MSIVHTEQHYPIAKKISWDNVVKKLSVECSTTSILWGDYLLQPSTQVEVNRKLTFYNPDQAPTYFMRGNYRPGIIGEVYDQVCEGSGVNIMHMYASLSANNSMSFGNHDDPVDVLLVQSKGITSYRCDDKVYTIYPGDSLFLPKGTYHEPIVNTPRITLSFSWE